MPARPPSPAEARDIVAAKASALVNQGIPVKTRNQAERALAKTVQIAEGPAAPVNHLTLTFNRNPATGAYDCTLG